MWIMVRLYSCVDDIVIIGNKQEIAYSILKLCQFLQSSIDVHWSSTKRVLRYLNGTSKHGVFIHKSVSLYLDIYTNVHWGSCPNEKRSN